MPPGGTTRGVTLVAKMIGQAGTSRDLRALDKDVEHVGTSVKHTDDQAGKAGKGWDVYSRRVRETGDAAKHAHSSLKGLVGAGTGLLAGYVGVQGIRNVLNYTGELMAQTHEFSTKTGIGASSSLDYVAALNARGIGATQAARALTMLSKNQQTAERQEIKYHQAIQKSGVQEAKRKLSLEKLAWEGNLYGIAQANLAKKTGGVSTQLGVQALAFKSLHIDLARFKTLNPEAKFQAITKAFEALPPGADKARVAMQVFGIGGSQLASVLTKGELSLTNYVKMAKRFFPELGKDGNKALSELMKKQAESTMAWQALQYTLGTELIPQLKGLMQWFVKVTMEIRSGKGTWGAIGHIAKFIVTEIFKLIGAFAKMKAGTVILAGALALLAVAWSVEKLREFYGWMKKLIILEWADAVATSALAAATTVLDIALWIGVGAIAAVILIFALLVVGVYLVIKHFDFFERIAKKVWTWLKQAWPIIKTVLLTALLGPIYLIVTHWNQFIGFFGGIVSKLAHVGKGMWNFIKDEFKTVVNFVIKMWNGFTGLFRIPGIHIHPPWPLPSVDWGGTGRIIPKIPYLGGGGTVRTGGSVVVGDRGPELLSLPPGARVDPLLPEGRSGLNQPGTWRGGAGGSGDLIISVQMDRKEVGRAVLAQINSQNARFA